MNKENTKYSYKYSKARSNNQNFTTKNLLKFKNKTHDEIFKLIFIDGTEHIGIHLHKVTKQTDKLFYLKNKLSQRNSIKELSI